ncbi:glycosyltransferase family 4 protein [Sporosarcina sp. FA9]|uniref:glycosyltransferase family 4 protein n=1 Tax=Sporosarcina sp. FA9 TaxID=3413030 RepID=UPI003F65AF47
MKILYVSTLSNTINAFMIPHIKLLLEQGHHVDIACNIDRDISPILTDRGCEIFDIKFQRSPKSKHNYVAYKKLKGLIQDKQYEVIHTHTPVASICVRLACRNMNNVRVMYTAHGFHFFKGAPLKNWLLYYPIEYWFSRYTDVLITINKEDYYRAKRVFKAKSVEYIPGVGLDTKKIRLVNVDKWIKRSELDIEESSFVILSVGELNKNKNHETIIKAVARLNNPNIVYIICGQGPLESYLRNLSKKLRVDKQVLLLGYREDIADICKAADVFAFPSRREGLGMAALEAMASGLPIITSNVHGIVDYSIDGKTGYCCRPLDVIGFAKAIEKLKNNESLRNKMGRKNTDLVEKFNLDSSLINLQYAYQIAIDNPKGS